MKCDKPLSIVKSAVTAAGAIAARNTHVGRNTAGNTIVAR